MKTWTIRLKFKKTKFFFGKQQQGQCRIVIPHVLDENRLLFLDLSQHGLQIASDF